MSRKLQGPAITIAVGARKGGPGKSTILANLAAGLALRGYSTLALEVDDNTRLMSMLLGRPQRNELPLDDSQTTYALFSAPDFGLGRKIWHLDMAHCRDHSIPSLARVDRERLIEQRQWHQATTLSFVPGSERLNEVEDQFAFQMHAQSASDFNPATQLHIAISRFKGAFDCILFDTPPSLLRVQENVMLASDYIIPVVDFDADSISDYLRFIRFYRQVRSTSVQLDLRPPRILGVVYNKYDASDPENDGVLYTAYTAEHVNPDTGQMEPPLVEHQPLARIPLDVQRCKRAMTCSLPLLIYAPTSDIGDALYQLVSTVETVVTAGVSVTTGARA